MDDEQTRLLISQLGQFTVCQLSDALGSSCPVETAIRPIDSQFRICGPALTLECVAGDNLTLHHALHLAKSGDVLVVGGSPEWSAALWGELMSISAQSRGLAGTIIDGAARDPMEIRALGYPVFCREINPCRASKQAYGRINVPVRIGNISISPGDLVLADVNGIVSISPSRAQKAIDLASAVVQKEHEVKNQILAGRTIFEIFKLEQYVQGNNPEL